MVELKRFYEFGDFRLDVTDKALQRNGENIPITNKVFETLVVLVENADRLVEKDELMQKIWHDRFVEESNLTFNIKMLRKALGDSAGSPTYIETVPRRGYRFIAEVREVSDRPKAETVAENISEPRKVIKNRFLIAAALLIAAVGLFGLVSWTRQKLSHESGIPILSAEFNSVKLFDSGKIHHSVLSPNGKFVAYTSEVSGRQSLWLRRLSDSNNTEILPASGELYYGLAFSNDSETLFFTRQISDKSQPMGLFSVPVTGGVPVKITENCEGWISVSPDDKQISFVRYNDHRGLFNHLMVIDVDGKNERIVKTSEKPNVFWAQAFSPDGKKIAAGYGHSRNSAKLISLVEIDLETGQQRSLTSQMLFHIFSLAWLPDQSGIFFSASESIGDPGRIWQLDYGTGKVKPVTNDSASYALLTLDKSAEKLVATTFASDYHLYVGEIGNPNNVKYLIKARDGLAYTADGKIVYASDMAGSEDIWIMDADGSNQRQLTNEKSLESDPLVSPDNQFIFFASNRTGERQMWRMNLDGSNQTQITEKEGGFAHFVSPDGKWLYFRAAFSNVVTKVPTGGGEETPVFAKNTGYSCDFSPDGRQMAYLTRDIETKEFSVVIISMENQNILKRYNIPPKETFPYFVKWTTDGKALTYITDDGKGKKSLWTQNLEQENPKFTYDLGNGDIRDFRFSPDKKTFAFIRGGWEYDSVLLTGLK